MNPFMAQLSEQQHSSLQHYVTLIQEVNTKINLVSRKDSENMWEHHIYPCLAYSIMQRIQPREYILDIGSGGGLPGIVNAIMYPESEFVLVDATRKKVDAVQNIIEKLELSNVQTIWSRIEELANNEIYRNSFDRATARAVAVMRDLINWSAQFLKSGGTLEAMKGRSFEAELEHLPWPIDVHALPEEYWLNDKLAELRIITAKRP